MHRFPSFLRVVMFISYAQNFEDVMLWRALKDLETGFYVDIGAQDPVIDSISRGFYEHGWRGVHVEPTPVYAAKLRADRPDEIVIEAAIGTDDEPIDFFEVPETGLSTGVLEIARMHEERGEEIVRRTVETKSLARLFDEIGEREIHWLKIDVEGMEAAVLESWLPSSARPWVLVVEATIPMSSDADFRRWEPIVLSLGYRFCYFDGLNRFYVHETKAELERHFGVGPNVFDDFALQGASSRVEQPHHLLVERDERIAALTAELDRANHRLDEVYTSRSWRWSRPLRIIETARRASASPRRHVRAGMERGLAWLSGHPRVKEAAISLLRIAPPLQRRLWTFAQSRGYGGKAQTVLGGSIWSLEPDADVAAAWRDLVADHDPVRSRQR